MGWFRLWVRLTKGTITCRRVSETLEKLKTVQVMGLRKEISHQIFAYLQVYSQVHQMFAKNYPRYFNFTKLLMVRLFYHVSAHRVLIALRESVMLRTNVNILYQVSNQHICNIAFFFYNSTSVIMIWDLHWNGSIFFLGRKMLLPFSCCIFCY